MPSKDYLHAMSYTAGAPFLGSRHHHQAPQVFGRPFHAIQTGDSQPADWDGPEAIIDVPFISYGVFGIMLKVLYNAYGLSEGSITLKALALGNDTATAGVEVNEELMEFHELSANATAPVLADLGSYLGYDFTVVAWCSPNVGESYAIDSNGTVTKTDKIRLVNDQSSEGNGSDAIPYSFKFCDALIETRNETPWDNANTPTSVGVGITWSNLAAYGADSGTYSQHILVQPFDGIAL